MEGRKNRYSLPSNYVTLSQLQERWLMQQTQINHRPQPPSRPRPQKQYLVKNPAADDHCKSEAVARIGDETADPKSKTNESKKQKNRRWSLESKTRERRASEEKGSGRAKRGEKAAEKTVIECELKKKKNGGSGSAAKEEEVVEQRVRISWITSETGKQNGRLGKVNKDFRGFHSQRKYYGGASFAHGNRNTEPRGASGKGSVPAAHGNEKAEKNAIESELKKEENKNKNNNNSVGSVRTEKVEQKTGGSVTMEKVEQRVRVLSIKSENNKQQNGKLRKTNNRFHSQKKYYGEAAYGYGNRYGRYYEAREQKTEKMVWFKKDG